MRDTWLRAKTTQHNFIFVKKPSNNYEMVSKYCEIVPKYCEVIVSASRIPLRPMQAECLRDRLAEFVCEEGHASVMFIAALKQCAGAW